MTTEETLYYSIGISFEKAISGQMYGKPCFKIENKAFICFYQNNMVFKLSGDSHKSALSLNGSNLFDPSGKNRPMKEWVQITSNHKDQWIEYAKHAMDYVNSVNSSKIK